MHGSCDNGKLFVSRATFASRDASFKTFIDNLVSSKCRAQRMSSSCARTDEQANKRHRREGEKLLFSRMRGREPRAAREQEISGSVEQ